MADTLTLKHAVGYHGVCRLGDDTTEGDTGTGKLLLCTGGNISLTQEPLMGTGVWGGGYKNATPIAYAWNYLQLEGSANYELTDGILSTLGEFMVNGRGNETGYHVVLKPDGVNGFDGNGWCTSMSFEASEGAVLTGSFNFKGDPSIDGAITATGNGDNSPFGTTGANAGKAHPLAGATLIPYWKTNVINNGAVEEDIISWSCSYNSDLQMLKCCNKESSAPLRADYILLGDMTGDCNYTVFTLKGNFSPTSYHSEKTNLKFNINDESITIPKAIINSASTSMATGASYITAEYSFTALGDGTGAIMKIG